MLNGYQIKAKVPAFFTYLIVNTLVSETYETLSNKTNMEVYQFWRFTIGAHTHALPNQT